MNFGDMQAKTRRLVQESSASRWSDDNIKEALNNRYAEAQDRVNFIRPGYFDTGALVNLVAGTTNYQRPFFKPVRGYYRLSGGEYVQCNVYSFDSVQPDVEFSLARLTPPSTFAVAEMGPTISVYPTPTANLTSGLKVLADKSIALTGDDDTTRLKPELDWLLPFGAAAELLADDPTYPADKLTALEAKWAYLFGPEPACAKRLARIYPHRDMGRLTMEPQTPVTLGARRFLNGGITILWG